MIQVRRIYTGYPLLPLFACCICLAFTFEVHSQEDNADARLQGALGMLLQLNTALSGSTFRVIVLADHATLEGEVADELSRELAAQLILSTPEIETLSNRLAVTPNLSGQKLDTSWASHVDDLTASALVIMLLSQSKGARGASIGVETQDGVATIHGGVYNDAQRVHIRRLVYETRGIEAIEDRMHRSPDAGSEVTPTLQFFPTDEELVNRVRTRIHANNQLHVRNLRVEVMEGICTLDGIVYTTAAQAQAVSLALDVVGVRGVSAAMHVNDGPPPLFDAYEPDEQEMEEEEFLPAPGETPLITSEPLLN